MNIDKDSPYENDLKAQEEEHRYFKSVLKTFSSYKEQSLLRVARNETTLKKLPEKHQKSLESYQNDLENIKKCILANDKLISLMTRDAHKIFINEKEKAEIEHEENNILTLKEGLDKVQAVFKLLMRDWSTLGETEREQCYTPIIEEILSKFPESEFDRAQIRILVPGAGLGRLAFEIASKGFICEGNEFNLFMLIVSFFVLNRCQTVNEHNVYPWVHHFVNNLKGDDQSSAVFFPDICPTPTTGGFSMTAGDFLDVYRKKNQFNCVATCFFIDCASNIVQFVERIYRILKPGGVWINLGPLLYHYADLKYENSVEPSYQVLLEVIKNIGFLMEKSKTGVRTKYCQNPNSMLQFEYHSVFFVCTKPLRK